MISITEIQKIFKGKISLNEPLARFTTFRIGGMADYYVEPLDAQDVLNIVNYASKQEIPVYTMGNGSNVLISDEGIRGIVINLEEGFHYLRNDDGVIFSGAGVKLAKLVDFCIQHRYGGVEMLAGIPATVGGALVMNAGCYGGETADYVTEVTVVKNGELKVLKKAECDFGYRRSNLRGTVVLEAKFKLPEGDRKELSNRRKELLMKRNESQPVEIPNAGCIFKNPKNNKAAILIEQCGLKGQTFGDAMVSQKHANFIVNVNNASASDVVELIKIIRKTVKEKAGVELELEVKPIGFGEHEI
ncbi:MAG: UDP-N-acetylmuramate dehydrogenase [Chlorobi bacterium]|nr:UDP-N-acetylmuramate dehydrogenase [Chlorobiota bacterium]MCI0715071.1 UDP-N-acetylmuramate dehydrogenase [Chlorobiota bacterium]